MVSAEYGAGAGVGGVSGDDCVNATRNSASPGALYGKAQMAGATRCGLVGVDGAEPLDDLVDRCILWTTGDRLREDHGGDDGYPSALDEIAQNPSELRVCNYLIDYSRIENHYWIAHSETYDWSLPARRPARRFVCPEVGSPASISSR